jgi:hypothetical protein
MLSNSGADGLIVQLLDFLSWKGLCGWPERQDTEGTSADGQCRGKSLACSVLVNSSADNWSVQLLDFLASLPESFVRIARVSSC